MQVFKTKAFARFARKEGLTDAVLIDAIERAEINPDADLGGGLIKQRVARSGQGRSGGFRTIIAFRQGSLAFFIYGFPKNNRGNISILEERALRKVAASLLAMPTEHQVGMIHAGEIMEVIREDESSGKE